METARFSQRWFLITSESRIWDELEDDALYPVLLLSVLDEVSLGLVISTLDDSKTVKKCRRRCGRIYKSMEVELP